jgi:hypothetical protein
MLERGRFNFAEPTRYQATGLRNKHLEEGDDRAINQLVRSVITESSLQTLRRIQAATFCAKIGDMSDENSSVVLFEIRSDLM